MKVFGVIPAYNEASRIIETVEAVRPHVDRLVVVDDGSLDETAQNARQAAADVFIHAVNRGQGAGLKTGTEAALRMGAEIIVHVDADGQHDPTFIASLVEPIKQGKADVVFGSRFMEVQSSGMPPLRRVLLLAARLFNTFVMGIPARVTDPQSGMRAMSRAAAQKIDFHQDRMAHCSEILRLVTHSSLRWMEVPIRVHYTADTLAKGQKSSDAFRIMWELLIGAFRR